MTEMTMLTKAMVTLGSAVSLCALMSLGSIAYGQATGAQPSSPSGAPATSVPAGTTSGPASGSPTTMGTFGTTTGTPHQLESLREPGSAVKREVDQGSGAAQDSGSVGTRQPGSPGTESGPSPPK
jgi:hypothetical protein